MSKNIQETHHMVDDHLTPADIFVMERVGCAPEEMLNSVKVVEVFNHIAVAKLLNEIFNR